MSLTLPQGSIFYEDGEDGEPKRPFSATPKLPPHLSASLGELYQPMGERLSHTQLDERYHLNTKQLIVDGRTVNWLADHKLIPKPRPPQRPVSRPPTRPGTAPSERRPGPTQPKSSARPVPDPRSLMQAPDRRIPILEHGSRGASAIRIIPPRPSTAPTNLSIARSATAPNLSGATPAASSSASLGDGARTRDDCFATPAGAAGTSCSNSQCASGRRSSAGLRLRTKTSGEVVWRSRGSESALPPADGGGDPPPPDAMNIKGYESHGHASPPRRGKTSQPRGRGPVSPKYRRGGQLSPPRRGAHSPPRRGAPMSPSRRRMLFSSSSASLASQAAPLATIGLPPSKSTSSLQPADTTKTAREEIREMLDHLELSIHMAHMTMGDWRLA